MPLLVVIGVAALAYFYLRSVRRARQAWLAKLDLPGRWRGQQGASDGGDAGSVELLLQGRPDGGEFVLHEGASVWRGEWRLIGHMMHLSGAGRDQRLDLHYFKPGSIGLENADGVRRLYTKATTNVVPLHDRGPSSRRQP